MILCHSKAADAVNVCMWKVSALMNGSLMWRVSIRLIQFVTFEVQVMSTKTV